MRKQLWMLIVLALALLVGCTEVAEDSDNSNNENNTTQESGNNQTGGNNNNNDNTESDYPDYPDEPEPDYPNYPDEPEPDYPDEPEEPAYLSAPTLTSAYYNESTGKISLSWSSVSNCSYYEIYYSTTGNDKKYLDYTTSTSASVTKSKEGVTYYFWIKAVGSSTSSAYSNYKTVYVPASWTPPTVYNEIEGTGTSNAIYANVTAGETYWFRFYASQPSNPYTYTISFFDMDSGDSAFTGDVVGDFYNQTGNIFASSVDNGTFGPSCSYLLSQYIYVKIQCVSSGSFAIYADKSR